MLRRWRKEDLAPFSAMNADPDVMAYLPEVLTREASDALAARADAHIAEHGWGLWAVEVLPGAPGGAKGFAGFTGLSIPRFDAPFMPAVEVGWRLARWAWGHGYATEAATASLDHGFGTVGLTDVVSITTVGNLRSRAVMERLGMTRDPADDFDHPLVSGPLRPHVLYRLTASDWWTRRR